MEWYIDWVINNRLLSAFIQFAILGTLGELISIKIKKLPLKSIGNIIEFLLKMLAWGILGFVIKYGFTGMKGFVSALSEHNLIPNFKEHSFMWAFTVSFFTNIFFGPQMMFFHRIEENLIMRKKNWSGLTFAWFTLIWFWIPAHTITFMLKTEYQIGLAAVWSVVLGIILGIALKKNR